MHCILSLTADSPEAYQLVMENWMDKQTCLRGYDQIWINYSVHLSNIHILTPVMGSETNNSSVETLLWCLKNLAPLLVVMVLFKLMNLNRPSLSSSTSVCFIFQCLQFCMRQYYRECYKKMMYRTRTLAG